MNNSENVLMSVIVRFVVIIAALFGALWIVYQFAMLAPLVSPSEQTVEVDLTLPSYSQWLFGGDDSRGILNGDFGMSFMIQRPATEAIFERIPASLELGLLAFMLSLLLGIPLGILMAYLRHRLTDIFPRALFLLGIAMPIFWVALMLVLQFGVQARTFPMGGRCPTGEECGTIFERFEYLALPLAALVIFWGSSTALSLRGMILGFARRTSETELQGRHIWQGLLLYLLNGLPALVTGLISSMVLVETIFAWPGIGRLTVDALVRRDYPIFFGIVATALIYVAVAYLLTTLLYAVLALITGEPAGGYRFSFRPRPENEPTPAANSSLNLIRNIITVLAAVILAGLVVSFSQPSLFTSNEPTRTDLQARLALPGTENHPLGTDELGRDLLARLLYGGRNSLSIAFSATILALFIGIIPGLLAGAFDGILGLIFGLPVNFAVLTIGLFPPLLLLALPTAVLDQPNLSIILGLVGWPLVATAVHSWARAIRQSSRGDKKKKKRSVSAEVITDEPFADTSHTPQEAIFESEETSSLQRMTGDQIARSTLMLLLFTATMCLATFLLAEAGLSFLGIGVQPPNASLGNLLAGSNAYMAQAPHLIFYPGLLLTLLVGCLYVIAMRANDAFDFLITESM